MKCEKCGHEMIELLTTFRCDKCDGLLSLEPDPEVDPTEFDDEQVTQPLGKPIDFDDKADCRISCKVLSDEEIADLLETDPICLYRFLTQLG